MVRATLRLVLGRVLALFFRRIEVVGLERIPATGPTLFAINHPNALVDPVLILCFAPRPVSFLAKEPLFRMPVIGWLVRRLDAIPVHRRQDAADPAKNRETFARARALLDRGGTIAIAPEGASHSDPALRTLKTGAARIALGAGTRDPVAIVPVGLFYTEKTTFRSGVLVCFGAPIMVAAEPLDRDGEPPRPMVERVTAELEERLRGLVVEADAHEALALAERTERLLTAALPGGRRSLEEVQAVRRRLVEGHRRLRERDPARLDRIVRRITRLERAFRLAALDPGAPAPPPPSLRTLARGVLWLIARVGVMLPLAIPGLVIHLPAYLVIGPLARAIAKEHDDALATVKILAAAVFYPLTWLALGLLIGARFGWPIGLGAGLLAPVAGFAALRLVERFDRFVSGTRALGFHLLERDHFGRLVAERESLRRDLLALEEAAGTG